jgi:hypothetical protein
MEKEDPTNAPRDLPGSGKAERVEVERLPDG